MDDKNCCLESARAQWRSWAVACGTNKTWEELVKASVLAVPAQNSREAK